MSENLQESTLIVNNNLAVQLQPPGAGLPFLELWLSRAYFLVVRQLMTRERASARFHGEGDRILALARSLSPSLAARRILIPRVRGIEDSSRYWSVFMVLDHLIIANERIITIIENLAAGKLFGREVSIAGVKPSPAAGAEVVDKFSASVQRYLARSSALENLHSDVKHSHPWFGPLDGHGWHCLSALHQAIHRRQVERIIRLI